MAAFVAQTLPAHTLMRRLVSFPTWVRPVSIEGADVSIPVLVTKPHDSDSRRDDGSPDTDERWEVIFTDPERLREFERKTGQSVGGTFVETTGEVLFAGLSDDVTGIDINPESVEAIHFKQHQFKSLREWAAALEVERVLAGADHSGGFNVLKQYDRYRVVMRQGEEPSMQMLMAPDAQGRRLAAVFTAEDTLKVFLKQASSALKDERRLRVLMLTGRELFANLAQMKLDGVVFNCAGPIPPKAVAAQLIDLVLNRG